MLEKDKTEDYKELLLEYQFLWWLFCKVLENYKYGNKN
jgi:hypothetical protein